MLPKFVPEDMFGTSTGWMCIIYYVILINYILYILSYLISILQLPILVG